MTNTSKIKIESTGVELKSHLDSLKKMFRNNVENKENSDKLHENENLEKNSIKKRLRKLDRKIYRE